MPNGNESDVQEDIAWSNDQEQVAQTDAPAQESAADEEAKRIADLEAELEKAKSNLQAARRFEKESKVTKAELEEQLREQGKFKTLYEQAIARENTRALDGALTAALDGQVESHNFKAVLKLVDRAAIKVADGVAHAESVEAAVLKAKEEFPALFIQVDTPAPKRATEGAVTGGFAKELEAASKSKEAYQEFLRKNNLI